jgi:3-hydroxyacyl-CoA dehydrogenase
MTAINAVTDLSHDGDVAVITLNSPPVNALSAGVREGLYNGVKAALESDAKAIVLICEGRTFIAGADITELGGEMKGPSLGDVQQWMESSPKPVIAAIHGTALGGGLEVALCAPYRVAVPSAKLGLPEVNLGLLPGAGGTQRLPRVVGPEKAMEMVAFGKPVSAKEALAMGLVDEVVEESPRTARPCRSATVRTRLSPIAASRKCSRRSARPTPAPSAASRRPRTTSSASRRR